MLTDDFTHIEPVVRTDPLDEVLGSQLAAIRLRPGPQGKLLIQIHGEGTGEIQQAAAAHQIRLGFDASPQADPLPRPIDPNLTVRLGLRRLPVTV